MQRTVFSGLVDSQLNGAQGMFRCMQELQTSDAPIPTKVNIRCHALWYAKSLLSLHLFAVQLTRCRMLILIFGNACM